MHPFGAAIEAGDVDAAVARSPTMRRGAAPGRRFRGNAGAFSATLSRGRTRETPGEGGHAIVGAR